MIVLDISTSPFVLDVEEEKADGWMATNIGKLIATGEGDDGCSSRGVGWKVYYDDTQRKWFAEFEHDHHATFFLLRWT